MAPKLGPRALVFEGCDVSDNVIIGAGCILHPRCRVVSSGGPITLGADCIIEEDAVIENTLDKPLKIGQWSYIRVGAHVRNAGLGDYNILHARCAVLDGIDLGDYCTVAPGVQLVDESFDVDAVNAFLRARLSTNGQLDAVPRPATIPSFTAINAPDATRMPTTQEGSEQQKIMHQKQLQYLRQTLPLNIKAKMFM